MRKVENICGIYILYLSVYGRVKYGYENEIKTNHFMEGFLLRLNLRFIITRDVYLH